MASVGWGEPRCGGGAEGALVPLDEEHELLAQARVIRPGGEAGSVSGDLGQQVGDARVALFAVERHGFADDGEEGVGRSG